MYRQLDMRIPEKEVCQYYTYMVIYNILTATMKLQLI